MTVPSYDDLTPGIPDEVDAESVGSLVSLLGRQLPASSSRRSASSSRLPACGPFACLREAGSGKREAASGQQDALLAIARDFSPRVMRVSDCEVLLDVSGLGRLIGEPPAIAAALARAALAVGIEASVALAPTQTASRLLAADARTSCATGGLPDLDALPVTLLQPLETLPPAINPRDRARPYETFERWGIHTLGDLAALPAAELSSRLGRRGVALQRLARGLDARPFVPDPGTPRYIGRLALEWPIEALEPLSFVLARLLEPLSAALERADRGAAAIRLDLRLTTRATHTRLLQLPAPMRDAKVLRTLLLLDLESHPPSPANAGFGGTGGGTSSVTAAVDIVTIELDPAPARITQFSLLERALPSPDTLSTLTARLSALVGEARVGSPVLLDTHRPGAFEMACYAPDSRAISSRRSDEVASLDDARDALSPGRRAKADAMTRFAPESRGVDGVDGAKGAKGALGAKGAGATGAEGANGAGATGAEGANGSVLRRQRLPPAIRVSVEHGRPVYIAAARRGMPQGAVTQAAGPWRTSGGWWSGTWNRDEWDVALTSGAVCRIFQDRTTKRWFLEGIYD